MEEKRYMRDIIKGEGGFELIAGVIHNNTLLKSIEMIEIDGDDEDILINPGNAPQYSRFKAVLERKIKKIGTVDDRLMLKTLIQSMTSGDRAIALILLRVLSLGVKFSFDFTCPVQACKKVNKNLVLNLGDMEIFEMPDPMKRSYIDEIKGHGIAWDVMTGEHEQKAFELRKQTKNPFDIMFATRVTSLDGKLPELRDLKKLPFSVRTELRQSIEVKEGGVETDIEMTCQHCGNEFSYTLDIGNRDFFFPSGRKKS